VKAPLGVAASALVVGVVVVGVDCVTVALGEAVVVVVVVVPPALAPELVLLDVPLLHPAENTIAVASVIAVGAAKRNLIFDLLRV
jgi:hypothetical protein